MNEDQIEILKDLNGTTVSQPGPCHFAKYVKGEWMGRQLYFQNWLESSFHYHRGYNDHAGIKEIFSISDLPQTDKIFYPEGFVDDLFKQLEPYDNVVIKFDEETKTINLPTNILLLKFSRELFCNPIVAIYDTRYNKEERGEFINMIIHLSTDPQNEIVYVEGRPGGNIKEEYYLGFVDILYEINKVVAKKYPWYHLKYKEAANMVGQWETYEKHYL